MSELERDLEDIEGPGFRDRLLSTICAYDALLYAAVILEVVLLLFASLSFLFGSLSRETRWILYLDFVLLGVAIVPTASLLYLCARQE